MPSRKEPEASPEAVPKAREEGSRRAGPPQSSGAKKRLRHRKTNPINVTELRVSGVVRRVGNGLAILIPVRDARKAGISAGDPVDAVIQSGVLDAFGLLKEYPFRPFERAKEKLWRDRI